MQVIDSLMPIVDEARKGPKTRADQTLAQALFTAQRVHGSSTIVAEDASGGPVSYRGLLFRAYVLSRSLARRAEAGRVGLMMPTATMTMAGLFAIQFLGRVATVLNFNAGAAAVLSACRTAGLKTILSSRAFVEKANLGLLVEALENAGVSIAYLEDLKSDITLRDKIHAARLLHSRRLQESLAAQNEPDDPAVILFTSGSEGDPKGVVLSHRNLLSNVVQFTSRLDVGAWDRMFCCLPLYHSFGLTVGALLPLFSGMRTFFYPSPLHYHEVPGLIRQTASTLLLTTDTFLTGYARTGAAADFASLRYIVAGAEKLKDQTRQIWAERFGKALFEGYGVTETAPVLSVNTPDAYRKNTVGRLLPDIEVDLRPIDGINDGAELWVRGPNIMLGYLLADAPGKIKAPPGGWHKTGDVVAIDEDGFMAIKGRIKRFAKVGGEMVSLVAIEQAVSRVCPGVLHAAVSVPHARKGEAIVLLTEQESLDADALRRELKSAGFMEYALPRRVIALDKIPVLGSGKIDYITAQRVAMAEADSVGEAPVRRTA